MICHLANDLEGCVHRADHYITETQPMIFVTVTVAAQLAHLVLCARRICNHRPGFRIQDQIMNRKGKISNSIYFDIKKFI